MHLNISFSNLYTRSGLIKLDETFLNYIKSCDESLIYSLIDAKENQIGDSQLIIEFSYLFDEFIAKLFHIEKEIEELKKKHNDFALIYKCKTLFVQRYALKKYINVVNIDITNKLSHFLTLPTTEKNFAEQVMHWFEDKKNYKEEIELAAQYVVWRVKNKESILFCIHKKIDHENLIPFSDKEIDKAEVLNSNDVKRKYGFDLTSKKVSLNKALDNGHYCIFCQEQNKDSCSKGLINNDNTFKQSQIMSGY